MGSKNNMPEGIHEELKELFRRTGLPFHPLEVFHMQLQIIVDYQPPSVQNAKVASMSPDVERSTFCFTLAKPLSAEGTFFTKLECDVSKPGGQWNLLVPGEGRGAGTPYLVPVRVNFEQAVTS